MAILEYDGDLLEAEVDVIGHQTNCVTNKVSGLAATLFKKYPVLNTYNLNPRPHIFGTAEILGVSDAPFQAVANMYSQYFSGRAGLKGNGVDTPVARLIALGECLNQVEAYMKFNEYDKIAFPYLYGCGLAGGNWNKYYEMFQAWDERTKGKFEIHIVKKV